jgi:hypothetical protein
MEEFDTRGRPWDGSEYSTYALGETGALGLVVAAGVASRR